MIKQGMLLLFLLASQMAGALLPIAQRLERAPVLLIGWYHSAADDLTPRILLEELARVEGPVSLVIEWPKGRPEAFDRWPVRDNMGSLAKIITPLREMGVAVVAGDDPREGTFAVKTEERDTHLAGTVQEERAKGRKVVLLVGGHHLLGVSRGLTWADVAFTSIATRYNVLTGEVRWGRRSLGVTKPDERFADGRDKFPEARWGKVGFGAGYADPERDYLFRLRVRCARLLR